MTVCAAALAANSRAIVCVADKAISYGEYIQCDSDSSKMVRLDSDKCVALFAGGERDISEVI